MVHVAPFKPVLRDEELENYLSSKISQVMMTRAQHIHDDGDNGDDEEKEEKETPLPIHEIEQCSIDNNQTNHSSMFDCCELVIDEDPEMLRLFSNSVEPVPESEPAITLEMAAMEKKQLFHNNHEIDPTKDLKCAEFYSRVGTIMQRVSSLKDPSNGIYWKGFKIIPLLTNWEDILVLMRPKDWCPEATYHATLVFLSFHNLRQLKIFLPSVLLKCAVDFIRTHSFLDPKLNLALRQVMRMTPALFCKSILIPLINPAQDGRCDLKEASLFGDILVKAHVPGLTVSTTLLSLAHFDRYLISHSVFIIILLEKHPALPFRVLASLVDHFCKSCICHSKMPSLWYQSLYLFVDM
ncbi:Bystin-domain-containing protein [Absidia repens]|uniref:Bystin-domain-containing protein n=1 Tax=Absidia repens TaxID=90262 RepID=A0A1X2IDE7_9FUNG|nr:Bystin-domain-containing protein [Absidia repens]